MKVISQRTLIDINSASQRAANRLRVRLLSRIGRSSCLCLWKMSVLTSGASVKRVFVFRFSVAAVTFTVRDLSV